MRAATIQAVAGALNRDGVPFIVVGGLAVVAHGYGRFTADIDLVIPLDADTVHKAFAALASLGFRPRVPVTASDLADADTRSHWVRDKRMMVLVFDSDQHPDTQVDVFVTEPFPFAPEYDRALVEYVAPGVPLRIVSLDTLLQMKAAAGRPQDLADIAELRALEQDASDE